MPLEEAVTVPDGTSSEQAAAAILQGMTAHYLCHSTYPVQAGDVVLVHAAAGGVGLLLTQMIKARGGARDRDDVDRGEGGARARRGRGRDDRLRRVRRRVRELTGGAGAHVVYDAIGATTFEEGIGRAAPARDDGALRHGVRAGAGVRPAAAAGPKSLYLTRPGLPGYTATREELLQRAGDVLGWIADGSLDVHIGERYPLEDARARPRGPRGAAHRPGSCC